MIQMLRMRLQIKTKQKFATAGTKTRVAERVLQHERFVEVLNRQRQYVTIAQRTMRSFKHVVYNIEESKIGLCAIDTKRYVLADGNTRAIGHKDNVVDRLDELFDCFD